jgi:hypothetical protein
MRRKLTIGALFLACLLGLSAPLVSADALSTTTTTKSCKTVHYDQTRLVWNATHTAKIDQIVYKVVPETATLDGFKSYVEVAVAVVLTKQVCSVLPAASGQAS